MNRLYDHKKIILFSKSLGITIFYEKSYIRLQHIVIKDN